MMKRHSGLSLSIGFIIAFIMVFFAVVPNLWADRNRPDLVVAKIFTTEDCRLALTVRNNGPGFFSNLVYADYEHKAVGVHVSIDGKEWGERKLWQFDKTRKLKEPEGTATIVFEYKVDKKILVTAAVDVYNILREMDEDNNTLSQEISCTPRSKSVAVAKPYFKTAASMAPVPVAKKPPQRFILDFKDIFLAYKKSFDSLRVLRGDDILSYGMDWEKCKPGPGIYHIRQEEWDGFFWEIDSKKETLYKVTNGDFCAITGKKEKIPATIEDGGNFLYVRFPNASLEYIPATKSMKIKTAAAVLADGADWVMCNLTNSQYHLKEGLWSFFYWKIDTLQKRAWRVTGKPFCKPHGLGETLTTSVRVFE